MLTYVSLQGSIFEGINKKLLVTMGISIYKVLKKAGDEIWARYLLIA
jgi:hypothetical protein